MKNTHLKTKILSLVLAFVIALSMMPAAIFTAFAASRFPTPNGGTVNGHKTLYWTIAPNNTGEQMYKKIESEIVNGGYVNSGLKQHTFISKGIPASAATFNESNAYSWQTECKNTNFTAGTYYIYGFQYGINVNYLIRYEYVVHVSFGYPVNISVSGASGSVAINGSNYSSGTYNVGPNNSLSFTVSKITDYTPTVTFNGKTLTANNGTYTISNATLAAATDRTIKLTYTMTNGSLITLQQPANATITINGSSASPQTIGKSNTYTLTVKAKGTGKNIITGVYVDDKPIFIQEGETVTVNWQPTAASHTITATTDALGIKVHDGKTVSIRDEMNAKSRAKAVINAIYDTTSRVQFNADSVILNHGSSSLNPGLYLSFDLGGNVMRYGTYTIMSTNIDYTQFLGDESRETVRIEFINNNSIEYHSALVTVNISKINISAKTALEKNYDGTPFTISTALTSNSQLQWQNNVGNVTAIEVIGHYDSNNNPLATAPTEVGSYYIRVKVTDSLGSNASDFIPYTIKECTHTGGTATCTTQAVCGICGTSYGEVDYYNHNGPYTAVFNWPEDTNDLYMYVSLNCACGGEADYAYVYGEDFTVESQTAATDCQNPGSVTYSVTVTLNGQEYPETKTYTILSDDHVGKFIDGFCSACGGYQTAVWNEEKGVYEISNAGQLYWYAQYLNTTNAEISAELTADIVIPENAPNWQPINASCAYFNGNYHTISGLRCVGTDMTYVGLFGMEGWWYDISNLHITDSYFEGGQYAGAIVAVMSNGGCVTNCYVTGTTVKSDGGTVGTLAGYLTMGSVNNCYVDTATPVGGYSNGYATIENCYYLSETETKDGGKTAAQFASGEVTWLLNGNSTDGIWKQTLGSDDAPGFTGNAVYYVESCTREIYLYSNSDESGAHLYDEEGTCTLCGEAKLARGDVNADGNVNILDVTVLLNYLADTTLVLKGNGDIDQEGSITISDVTALLNLLAGN